MDDVTAVLGEKLQKPEDPVRESYYLEAWCTDMDLNNAWDFSEDTVKGNMTLYAKWAEGEPQSESQTGQYGIIVVIVILAAAAGGAVWYRKKETVINKLLQSALPWGKGNLQEKRTL